MGEKFVYLCAYVYLKKELVLSGGSQRDVKHPEKITKECLKQFAI